MKLSLNMYTSRIAFAIVTAGLLTACGVRAGSMDTTESNVKGEGAAVLSNSSSTAFIREAAKGNQSEVALAEVAQQNAQNAEVKQFAQQMKEDHTAANQKLQPIADAHGIQISQANDAKEQKKLEKMRQLSGAEFDKEYMTDMLKDHVKDISKFEVAASQLRDADVKQYASDTLPTLREHLRHAEQVARSAGVESSTISSIVGHQNSMGGSMDNQESTSGHMGKSPSNP
jgi:putative membrane protein